MQGPSACICEVKFLFPLYVQANPELTAIWAVGQRIWQRDFPGIYTAIAAFQWSENILPVMEALRGKIKSIFSVYKYVTFDNHYKGNACEIPLLPLKWVIYICFSCFLFVVLSSAGGIRSVHFPP